MKMKNVLVFAVVAAIALLLPQSADAKMVVRLMAGQHIPAGDVVVSVSDDLTTLFVDFVPNDYSCLKETHLHVAKSLDGIPMTKKLNPKIGNFANKSQEPCSHFKRYEIPFDMIEGEKLLIAAHAVVDLICPPETGEEKPSDDMRDTTVTHLSETMIPGTAPSAPGEIDCEPGEETAWGEGLDFGGNSWAMYIEYIVEGSMDPMDAEMPVDK